MRAEKTLRNRSIHHKTAKNSRGISPVISTIIISGTLLIILVIASFVSANVLELQIASTEFEQAKTNMILLDQVIQDVAMRRGAGGYVQFNQRSGGINIIQHTETIQIFGPGEQTPIINNPSSVPAVIWTTPTNAYTSNNQYAYTSTANAVQQYGNYGFNFVSGTPIVKVEVGFEAYTAGNEEIGITCSWDNGATWAAEYNYTLLTSDPNTVTWVDFTTATTWTPEKLTNGNFRTKTKCVIVGGAKEVFLDWIPVRVTYIPLTSPIPDTPLSLVSLVYRGGSKVSGTDLNITGNNILNVSLTDPLGYLRIETGSGIQIKLDYFRARITNGTELIVSNVPTTFIEITFFQLEKGETTGSGTVNVKAQNININTITHSYDTPENTITLSVIKYGTNGDIEDHEDPTFPVAAKTVIMLTVITVKISISQG